MKIIAGYGTNVRVRPGGNIIRVIPKAGILGEWIEDRGDWKHYDFGWIHKLWHASVEIEEFWTPAPFVSQFGMDADKSGGDCGAASVVSVLAAMDQVVPTVDDVAIKEFHLSKFKRLGSVSDVIGSLNRHGLPSYSSINLSMYVLLKELAAGRPFIQLVDYELLPDRFLRKYMGGHFVTVYACSRNGVYIHDPAQFIEPDPDPIPWTEWASIIGQSGYNSITQGVLLHDVV